MTEGQLTAMITLAGETLAVFKQIRDELTVMNRNLIALTVTIDILACCVEPEKPNAHPAFVRVQDQRP